MTVMDHPLEGPEILGLANLPGVRSYIVEHRGVILEEVKRTGRTVEVIGRIVEQFSADQVWPDAMSAMIGRARVFEARLAIARYVDRHPADNATAVFELLAWIA